MTDNELERMLKNLKMAFADASDYFETQRGRYPYSPMVLPEYRESAGRLAEISSAYLQASQEQCRRDEEKLPDLGKCASITPAKPHLS